jgi:hypothetical protein
MRLKLALQWLQMHLSKVRVWIGANGAERDVTAVCPSAAGLS